MTGKLLNLVLQSLLSLSWCFWREQDSRRLRRTPQNRRQCCWCSSAAAMERNTGQSADRLPRGSGGQDATSHQLINSPTATTTTYQEAEVGRKVWGRCLHHLSTSVAHFSVNNCWRACSFKFKTMTIVQTENEHLSDIAFSSSINSVIRETWQLV